MAWAEKWTLQVEFTLSLRPLSALALWRGQLGHRPGSVHAQGTAHLTKLTSGLAMLEHRAVLAQQTGQRLNQEH